MTPLAILLERADAAMLAYGDGAEDELLRQIRAAVRNGEHADRVRDLDHILQLIEYRERPRTTRSDDAGQDWLEGFAHSRTRSGAALDA